MLRTTRLSIRRGGWLPLVAAVSLLGAACGAPTDESPTATATAVPTPTATATAVPTPTATATAVPTLTPSLPPTVEATPFTQPATTTQRDASVSGRDPLPSETGEWPFVAERPPGSAYIPIEAAAIVFMSQLRGDWKTLMDVRKELDPEMSVLRKLRDAGSLTDDQDERRRDILFRMTTLDDFLQTIEQEIEGGLGAALTKAATFLDFGLWTIEYSGDGIWLADTGIGVWKLDEPADHVAPLEPES